MCLKAEEGIIRGTIFRHKGGRGVAYVREKKVRNKKTGKTYGYYQLVEGVWEGGKVRQKVLAHLGEHPSLEAAMEAAAREIREGQRAQMEGRTDKVSRIYEDIWERWGYRLWDHRYFSELPTPEEAIRKAYPKGWSERPRRGQKFRRAFGLSDNPGEDLKSVGEFVVQLKRFWKARKEGEKYSRAYDRLQHFGEVREYLEEKRSGAAAAKSFEEYMRAKNAVREEYRRR